MIVLCAVCEKEIDEVDAQEIEFQGGHYYLCSDACLGELRENPEAYANEEAFEEVF